jgi:hypothetical protein
VDAEPAKNSKRLENGNITVGEWRAIRLQAKKEISLERQLANCLLGGGLVIFL